MVLHKMQNYTYIVHMHKNIINKENNLQNHYIKTKLDLKVITIVSQVSK